MSEPDVKRVVGRYEILREIGRGGMATVYAARQPDLDREVALKELNAFHAASPEFAHRFLRESRLAGSLNHRNIVTVFEYFEHERLPYIAMEYLSRGSLRGHVGHLSLAQIAGVLEGVLAGLAHAESAKIVHRDVKPENILLTEDGGVKIADFGIARATERAGTSFATATGMTVGTPAYMAPEQAMAGNIGPWTDLYSVGVLAYELVVGKLPFHDVETPMAILMHHVNEPIKPAIEVKPDTDPQLSAWIDALLVKEPSDRVQRASLAWESLEEIVVRLVGPLWRREARIGAGDASPEQMRPLTPAQFKSRSDESPEPSAARTEQEPLRSRPRPRGPILAGGALLVGAAAIGLLAIGSGGGRPGLSPLVPECVGRFLAGTAVNKTLVREVLDGYTRVGTEEKPVGLVLGPGRPVGAVRLIHHVTPTEYFEIQGAIDASTCKRVTVRDIARPGAGNNIVPYDEVEVDLTPTPYYMRPGPASPTRIEVGFSAQRPTIS